MFAFGPLVTYPLTSLPSAAGNLIIVSLTEAASAIDIDSAIATFNTTLTEVLNATETESVPLLNKADFSSRPLIRDWWDRDEWGRFIPGHGTHRG